MSKLKLPRHETDLDKLDAIAKQLSVILIRLKIEPAEFVALIEDLGIEDTQMVDLVLSNLRRRMKQDSSENS